MSHAEQIEALKGLLERARDATGADRRLDYELFRAFAEKDAANHWDPKAGHLYTASVDAALALMERVLPGWDAHIYRDDGDGGRFAAEMTYPPGTDIGDAGYFGTDGRGKTRPLAIVEGILASKQALLEALAAKAAPLPDSDTGGRNGR